MSLQGLDVSDAQGVVRWPNVAAAGYSFGFAKASEGVGWTAWSFGGNWKGMQLAGMVRGAYHFSRVANDPLVEANFFLSAVGPLSAGDLLALDLEDERATGDISGYALAFLDECYRQTGVRPFWYSYPYYIENHGLARLFDSPYPAWLVNPVSGWPDTLLQLLNGGYIDGIQGPVDLDDFAGTEAQLLAYGKGGAFSYPTKTLPSFSPGGSDATMAILARPAELGIYDLLVVGNDKALWHNYGTLAEMAKGDRWHSYGGGLVPGTVSASWSPDEATLVVSAQGPTGYLFVKEINRDGSVKTDWTRIEATSFPMPEGKQGPPGTVPPHSHPLSLTGTTGKV